MNTSTSPEISAFAADVLEGLSSKPKSLSSKYFYDDEGSRLFQEIMKLPEYYLTGCELEIFENQAESIRLSFVRDSEPLDLVELGAGDGSKTAVLIRHFLAAGTGISYTPIDISQEALNALTETFRAKFPTLEMHPLRGDYFDILNSLKDNSARRKVIMFLGSNIGNFTRESATEFFTHLRSVLNPEDLLFIGFDLQKDPHVIVPAYDDPGGVTAEFNLNLLRRINRELGGDFDPDQFLHYANYRPNEGSARSFLISRIDQEVTISALRRSFHFDQWEPIFMEISQKYGLAMIQELANDSGFTIKQHFFDSRNYYCDSLWQVG